MPPIHTCVDCHRLIRSDVAAGNRPHGTLCAPCFDALGTTLSRLPRLYAEAEQALAPDSARSFVRVSGNSRAAALPVRSQAVEARAALMAVLSSWSALVADERRVAAPDREVREMVAFLRRHLEWLARHPALAELLGELAESVALARRCVQPGQSRQVQVGACREPECAGNLIAHMRSAGAGPASEIRCDSDPAHRWAPHEWHAFIPRAACPV
ncbi:hypothetical protein [Streptomyces sp. NPDC085596]|uniref:hypothetical protein n=1 Tax=Streptomyces sp. NPDC085596 TaxID=3365731 RepID=UPI0037D6E6B4